MQGNDIPTQENEETVTVDQECQGDEIPTQQSTANNTAKVVQDGIAAGVIKNFSMRRRAKSERIAKKGKPFNFGADGAGSSADKAWDVEDVLREP